MNCKVCQAAAVQFAEAIVLKRHPVRYYRCAQCGVIQTEEPYWLDEAYSSPITKSDIGMTSRNIGLAIITQAMILSFFDKRGKFLDYGGGYGLLVRLMRDFGYDYYRHDRYCENLAAHGFDGAIDGSVRYELLTAFEVLEHLIQPVDDIGAMLDLSRNVLFTTMLIPKSVPRPGEWWYYGLEHGQHVIFYTREALNRLAGRFGLHCYTNGRVLHLMTEKTLSSVWFSALSRLEVALIRSQLRSRRSLLAQDYEHLTGQRLG